MAINDLQKQKIKNWAREHLRYLDELPGDTTPQLIRDNRKTLLPLFVERDDIETLEASLPPRARAFLAELRRLLYEYENYFSPGYQSSESIDELPDKLRLMLARIIKADI